MVNQGDIVFINFDPTKGHEQNGYRPAVIVSNNYFNAHMNGLVLALPITSKKHQHPMRIDVNGKKIKGQILADQIRSLDLKARPYKLVETLDKKTLSYIIALVKAEL